MGNAGLFEENCAILEKELREGVEILMAKTARAGNGITEGVIWKQLLLYFFPILFGSFFQQLYNTTDAVIVGNFVGKEALAAVGGSTGTLINLLVGFFVGLSSGATVIISQLYGAQRLKEVSDAVHTAVALSIVGSLILMVIGLIFAPLALEAMGTPDDVMGYAVTYIRIYFCGTVFSLFYNMGAGILRAVGDSKRPLYFLIASCGANILLDLLFVVVFRLEVVGVAIATVLSQVFSAVLVLVTLIRSTEAYQLVLKRVRFHKEALKQIIRIGLPAGFQSAMYNISNVIIQSSINSFGTDVMAAWTAYGKIDCCFWMLMNAFGLSASTFVGQNFGAQNYPRMRKTVRVCMGMATAATLMLSMALYFFGGMVYRLFTNDTEVIRIGVEILKMLVPTYFTYICIEILCSSIRGTGDSVIPTVLTCFGVCVLRVAWIAFAVPVWHSVQTVVFSYPLTWSVTSILFIIYYLQGGWLRRRIKANGFAPEERHTKRKTA